MIPTLDHGALERVAVDQHRRGQRLEALDVERVEHARADPAEVDLAGSDILHDLLLGVGGEVPPLVHGLDAQVAAGELLDAIDEVRHCGREVEVAVGIGQAQHLRLACAARLVLAVPTAGAGRRGERRGRGEGECREYGFDSSSGS